MAATGVAAAIVAGETLSFAGAAGAVTPDTWAQLRMCEASGNYSINTGNGYYGAYQFNLPTWQGLGYAGLPSDAPPAVQDEAAQRLYQQRGWQPWPACSVKLGLVDDRAASRDSSRPPLPSPPPSATPVSAPAPASPAAPSTPAPATPAPSTPAPGAPGAPSPTSVPTPWDGHYMTVRDVWTVRQDVREWQTKMVALGYHITIDGRYGPQSAAAATQFEIDHGLGVERPGVVGPQVWGSLFGK